MEEFIKAIDEYYQLNRLHHMKAKKFIKYLLDRDLIVLEKDFLYYNVNCQSQLLSLFMRSRGNDIEAGPNVPDSAAMAPFSEIMSTI